MKRTLAALTIRAAVLPIRLRLIVAALVVATSAAVAPPSYAGALTDYLEGKIIGHVFQGAAYTAPTTVYVALYTTACTDSAAGTEVSGGSYARVAITASAVELPGPTSGNGTISNASPATFPAPSASWGTVTHWGLWDAATAGNALVCASLTTNKTINNGDAAPVFGIGGLTVQIDN